MSGSPEIAPNGQDGTERKVAPESLLITVLLVLGLVSLLVGAFVNESIGTILLFLGATVIGWWYDRRKL